MLIWIRLVNMGACNGANHHLPFLIAIHLQQVQVAAARTICAATLAFRRWRGGGAHKDGDDDEHVRE